MELIALQLILGSDPWREAMNFGRARALPGVRSKFWRERWNILFSEKVKRGKAD